MKFKLVERKPRRSDTGQNVCFLFRGDWNDYNFYTSFELVYFDNSETLFDIGVVKIMQSGMDADLGSAKSSSVEIPDQFEKLSDEHCSLGQGQDYYLSLIHI